MKAKPPGISVKPPTKLTVLLAVVMALVLGSAAGVGLYTFIYAKGASYLRDDPASCVTQTISVVVPAFWSRSTGMVSPGFKSTCS